MRIVTVTEARRRLGHWLKKAVAGEDIGFVIDAQTVALRLASVCSDDYALQEYGLTKLEVYAAVRRIEKSVASKRRSKSVKPFTGNADDLRN